jgi:signal transduction histidine kinase
MIDNSLKTQLTMVTLLPMLITLIFIFSLVSQEFTSKFDEEMDSRANAIASQATSLAEFYLYVGDVNSLNEVSQNLIQIPHVDFIKFISATGQLLAIAEKSAPHTHSHPYIFPIRAKQVDIDDFDSFDSNSEYPVLGFIEMGLSNSETDAKRRATYHRLIIISLTALIFGFILTLLVSRNLKKSITDLTSTAKSIQHGRFDTRCNENGSGELLEFQQIFNKMAASFQQSEHELNKKIEAATIELHHSIDELEQRNTELDASRKETIELERSQAISDERERIMKDMHDGIGGQLITSIALLEREKDSELKTNISQILNDCLNDLRLIINSLHTANNSLDALLADLKYRTSKKLEQMNIKLVWRIDDVAESIVMTPQSSLHLLRILQETFTNILKHANATQIEFTLSDKTDFISIEIIDDGNFKPEPTATDNGLGLSNMKKRATFLGADLKVEQADNGGCRVSIKLIKAKVSVL